MKRLVYLGPALLAVLFVIAALAGSLAYAQQQDRLYVHALAARFFNQKIQGSALQREAFRQSDLLVVYGASEIKMKEPFDASLVFANYPTGFTTFPVAYAGMTAITYLQQIAAIGPELRGKKVVVSITSYDLLQRMMGPGFYAGNFSRLHASELAFSTDLSLDIKQGAARRMLDYPNTLEKDPLLKFAVERLAGGSPFDLALYYAVLPLGKLQNLILNLQDYWETLNYIQAQRKLSPVVTRQPAHLDWPTLLTQATAFTAQRAGNNPFGFSNGRWLRLNRKRLPTQKGTMTDQQFLDRLEQSKGWVDLNLLLKALQELGAQPLIICTPLHGPYFDYLGVSPTARLAFYKKLHATIDPYGFPLTDFQDHEDDKYFEIDPVGHLSSRGWIYYDQVLDNFYHTGNPLASAPEARSSSSPNRVSKSALPTTTP